MSIIKNGFYGNEIKVDKRTKKIQSKIKRKEKISIMVIRTDKKEEMQISKPCKHCIRFMKMIGMVTNIEISKIYYFDENKNMVCEKLKDIKSEHASNGWRNVKPKSV